MVTAIILAGGTGQRVGAKIPKQFIEVLNKPILAYTIDIFERHQEVDSIEIVCHQSWLSYLNEIVNKYGYKKVKWITEGGETFQDSVIKGINYLKDKIAENDYVLVQYGAAPFTSGKVITNVIDKMKEKKSAVAAIPCYQLLGSNDGDVSIKWVDRDKYIQIACPYGFEFGYLLNIYKRAEKASLLDKVEPHTTSIIYALGDKLNLVYCDQTNIKITTSEDIDLFEGYILMKKKKNYNI